MSLTCTLPLINARRDSLLLTDDIHEPVRFIEDARNS